jgi:L-lactate dehydrogenase complex protein LldG
VADARTEILGRIRAALARRPEVADVPRDYDRCRDLGDVLDVLAERLADYHALVRRATVAELPDVIASALRARAARVMVAPPDLPAPWLVDSVRWLVDRRDEQLSVAALDGADGVLTGCAVAIAETGTLILDTGARQGRRALTLLPDYHLCVVRADQVVGTVPEGIAAPDPTRPLTFVSGPSATSDIELNRVEGVHGPRTLEVIIAT